MIKNIKEEGKLFQAFLKDTKNFMKCISIIESVRFLDFYTDEQKYEMIEQDMTQIGEKRLAKALIAYFEMKRKEGGQTDETR